MGTREGTPRVGSRGLGRAWDGRTGTCGQGGLSPRPSPARPVPPQCSFEPGQVIIREGDEGENFYIILKGEVGAGPRAGPGGAGPA